jgi:hypothetical protein
LDFTASALQIQTAKAPSADFYLLEALAGSNRMFYVRGDGEVGINKLKTLSGGQTVSGGGLFVEQGGCTILDIGLNVYSASNLNPALKVTSQYAGELTSSYSVLQLSSVSNYGNQFFLINAMNKGKSRFSVRGDGAVFIRGGLEVTGGTSVMTGGAVVTGGLTIHDVGLVVRGSGITLTGGMTINTQGLKVNNGGLQVYGGSSIYSGGMKVAGGVSIDSVGLSVTNGLSVNTNGIIVSGGLTINNAGAVITSGGLTIRNVGLMVLSGGLTVSNGGLYLTGGLTLGNGGIAVKGGVLVTGGLTLKSGNGLYITDSGLTVNSGGLYIGAGGMTSNSGGLYLENGLTVHNDGLYVSGGLTVENAKLIALGGLVVTGGMSVFDTGLFSSAGATIEGNTYVNSLTVHSNSVFDSSLVKFQGGVWISGGLTVEGTTMMQFSEVVYSDRRLKTNLSPISDALNKVSRLKGVYFDWIQNEPSGMKFDEKRHVGVIAQEVEKVLPEVVNQPKGKEKYLSVDYPALVPLLIEAIHDLEGLVDRLVTNQKKMTDEMESIKTELRSLNPSNN